MFIMTAVLRHCKSQENGKKIEREGLPPYSPTVLPWSQFPRAVVNCGNINRDVLNWW